MDGQNAILGIAGRKGSGKSTLARTLITDQPRLAVIDTLGEYEQDVPAIGGIPAEQVYYLATKTEENFRASFKLSPAFMSETFNGLCKAAYMAGNMTLLIEEIDYFSKPGWNEEGLDLLIRYGRHRNLNIIYTVRNLVETSRRLTSQTDVFVFFRIDEPRYLDEIENRLGPETSIAISQLGEHEYTTVNVK